MTIHTGVIYIGSDNIAEYVGFRSATSGQYLNSATATVTLVDSAGVEVTGGPSWPLSMAYVDESNGTYRATLPAEMSLTEYGTYTATIDIEQGAGTKDKRVLKLLAKYRGT